jgi:hypothetical protein
MTTVSPRANWSPSWGERMNTSTVFGVVQSFWQVPKSSPCVLSQVLFPQQFALSAVQDWAAIGGIASNTSASRTKTGSFLMADPILTYL